MLTVRRKKNLVLFTLISVIFLTIALTLNSFTSSPSDHALPRINRLLRSPQEWKLCSPLQHIFFLKMHKCGSSTVQNILMRRGKDKRINFVIPKYNNYLGHPEPFNISQIGSGMMDDEENFDIFTHHTRFHAANVRSVMPPDTKKITILREPSSLFESLFNFFRLHSMFENVTGSLNLATLLSRNEVDNLTNMFHNVPRWSNRFGINQMAFDLGLDNSSFRNEQKIQELLQMIEAEFDLVLLSEYMEVSMVLLADLMCWPLEEVVFLSQNMRPANEFRTQLSTKDKEKLRKLNNVDVAIYTHFRVIFKERVLEYGQGRMQKDVQRLIEMNQALMYKCVEEVLPPMVNDSKILYPVTTFKLLNNASTLCKDLTRGEIPFTKLLRDRQKKKFELKKRVHSLLLRS